MAVNLTEKRADELLEIDGIRLFKQKTNRLKGRFVFDRIGFSDGLLR